ncbi:thermonuclease family protein [Rothia nasisuis]|uniref:thermonuclease family protein n=1 Tax=Rothia nasisuis TaxID=2109647 RepID=UPI001F39BA27|nr:thermonuclease family protein [Rothia nasisuis]
MKAHFARTVGMVLLASLALTSCGGGDTATVKRVIDGDTIEVEYQGKDATVRLLNIDTPETKHPNQVVECLGPEASQFLTDMLPEGTPVTLEFDQEKTDKYDRLLAGVFTEDGTFVNEAIAREGLGNAIKIAPNEKFYPQILKAQEEAEAQNRGLFELGNDCSIHSAVLTVVDAIENPASPEALIEAFEVAEELLNNINNPAEFTDTDYVANLVASAGFIKLKNLLSDTIEKHRETYNSSLEEVAAKKAEEERKAEAEAERKAEEERQAAEAAEAQRVEAERLAAEQAEAERVAAEQAAAAQAEADRLAAEQAVEAERQRQAQVNQPDPAPNPAPDLNQQAPAPDSAPAPDTNPYPGYTGPRCYAPGGKSWTPCPNH